MIQLVSFNNHKCERLIRLAFKANSRPAHPFHTHTEEQASTTNATPLKIHIPVLPSFVHVFMLLHHDRVSCWNINDDPDREEIMASVTKDRINSNLIIRKHQLKLARLSMHKRTSYCAVLVRMDVRRACSSVRAEGTLVVFQSVPLGGLLTGLGWGISGLRSSGS